MKNYFLSLLFLSVVISGCQLGNTSNAIPDVSSAFEGDEGLVLSFFENAPPDKVVPGATMPIAILIENKGAADVTCDDSSFREDAGCGYFVVDDNTPIVNIMPKLGESGAPKSTLLKDALIGTDKIEGKESYLAGGRAVIELTAKIEHPRKETRRSVIANICYPYKTFVSTSVCIATAHYTVPEDKLVCDLKSISLTDQGAPVAVKKIEQDSIIIGNKARPRFKIFISKVGKGIVLKDSAGALKNACTPNSDESPGIGTVTVEEATLSGINLDCENESKTITGRSSNEFIECGSVNIDNLPDEFNIDADNNLVATLKITLSYGFQTSVSKSVKIEVLDEPPEIKKVTVDKEINPGEPFNMFFLAEDDFGLENIQLLERSKVLVDENSFPQYETLVNIPDNPFECKDKLSCENTFTLTAPYAEGRYFYVAQAVDTSDLITRRTVLVVVNGEPPEIIEFEVPETALPGEQIKITITASDDSKVDYIQVFNKKGDKVIDFDCIANPCNPTGITVKVPETAGDKYSYKIVATDIVGQRAESEFKEGVVEEVPNT
ncbi:hypothetical protein CMO88_03590 [Candidatus Woesearchaeota archaeon]|nr:hypothetical protein [Candidatus Woesearchaeota archaeon]|tara:strand:+ start:8900 stop:10549 length:1650 start_codon:yes stop_codon:yes gene_type:complete